MLRSFFPLVTMAAFLGPVLIPSISWAVPVFAERLNAPCSLCHWAYPELNEFGEEFDDEGYRLPKEAVEGAKEIERKEEASLMDRLPLALRIQSDLLYRPPPLTKHDREFLKQALQEAERPRAFRIQAPWAVRLIFGGEISESISYYIYYALYRDGQLGPLEDAWVNFQNFGIENLSITVGQYELADFMFSLRLTRQGFLIYGVPLSDRGFNLGFQQGVNIGYGWGPWGLNFGVTNGAKGGKGSILRQYLGRTGSTLATNEAWSVYGRVGIGNGPIAVGFFGLYGSERAPSEDAGLFGRRSSNLGRPVGRNFLQRAGPDFKLNRGRFRVWGQWLWAWDSNPTFVNLTAPSRRGKLQGGFLAASWSPAPRWVLTAMWNRIISSRPEVDANIYTANATWYWRQNFKFGLELNYDAMRLRESHPYSENNVIVFFDTAF